MAEAPKDPIETKYHALMQEVARTLDDMLNPGHAVTGIKTTGFMLTVFDFDKPNGSRFNYISNANKIDVRAMLKDVTARIEGRMMAESKVKQ